MTPRAAALKIFRAALKAADPYEAVLRNVRECVWLDLRKATFALRWCFPGDTETVAEYCLPR